MTNRVCELFGGRYPIIMGGISQEPELGAAFINHMLQPSVLEMLSSRTYGAPSVEGINFAPDVAKYLAYPESKMVDMGLFTPDWNFIIPRRPAVLERYNQLFTI